MRFIFTNADVQHSDSYQVDICKCFEKIPCVELLKIVVNKDMFEEINLENAGNYKIIFKFP